jgi:hypothetical protein
MHREYDGRKMSKIKELVGAKFMPDSELGSCDFGGGGLSISYSKM